MTSGSQYQAHVEVNSLLLPPLLHEPHQESIAWDVLFDSDYARITSRLPPRSWNDACEEPCTSPPVDAVSLCSPCFPWIIDVENPRGVTCGDILDSLHTFLDKSVSLAELESIPGTFKASIDAAYKRNRRTPRGKRFYGPSLRRCEILRSFTVWHGVVQNDKYVQETLGPRSAVTLVVLLKVSNETDSLPAAGDLDAALRSLALGSEGQQSLVEESQELLNHKNSDDISQEMVNNSLAQSMTLEENGCSETKSCYCCHLQSHVISRKELLGIPFIRNHQSLEELFEYLSYFDIGHAVVLASSIQTCLTACTSSGFSSDLKLKLLQDTCAKLFTFPDSYWIKEVKQGKRIGAGGEATVYEGSYKGRAIVIREFHPPDGGDWESQDGRFIHKLIIRECIAHHQLRHPNIVEFLGIHQGPLSADPPSMVLSRAHYRSTMLYLQEHPSCQQFLTVVQGIANGLEYLHTRTPPFIHGDLHPGNLVVNRDGTVQLCDFGLSRIRYEITRTQTTIRTGGRLRFLPPELTLGDDDGLFRTNEASDIYAFAMTIYSLGTQASPFKEITNEFSAAQAAQQGRRPHIPSRLGGMDENRSGRLMQLVVAMWNHDPLLRPTARKVGSDVESVLQSYR